MLSITLEQITPLTYAVVFLVGVGVCFTPCVYPLIPVIVGYIGGADIGSKKEGFLRSLAYVLGLALVYSSAGAAAAVTGTLFGALQRNFWINLFVANIFIIMGLFMLDVFHMPQFSFGPRPAASKESLKAETAFLLGAVSGLIIGPCLTPVLGVILAYAGTTRNVLTGAALLFTYALGMGLPLLLLGTFVGLLKKMPKSGPWMLRVKKIFGLMMIAMGEYVLLGIR